MVREIATRAAAARGPKASHAFGYGFFVSILFNCGQKKRRTAWPLESNRCIFPARYQERNPSPANDKLECPLGKLLNPSSRI